MWNLTLINTGEWILFGQVHEIVDLTLLIDQTHPFTVFWFKYLCNKAVGFTTHLAMRKGWLSLGLLPLLTHHNLYRSFALSILTQVHDSWYSKSMVFIDSDDLLQTSRPLIHEPVRPDDEMIYSITRIRCPLWFNATHCDRFCSRLLPFGLIIHPRLAIIIVIILCSRWGRELDRFLIYTIPTQFRVISGLPRRWWGLQYTFSDKAMYEHGYPFGPTSRRVRIWEF